MDYYNFGRFFSKLPPTITSEDVRKIIQYIVSISYEYELFHFEDGRLVIEVDLGLNDIFRAVKRINKKSSYKQDYLKDVAAELRMNKATYEEYVTRIMQTTASTATIEVEENGTSFVMIRIVV